MEYSGALKAIADTKRFQILKLISQTGEMNAISILEHFNITQPTLSHHMKLLADSELVNVRQSGLCSYYSINTDTINGILNIITDIIEDKTDIEEVSQTNRPPILRQKHDLDESLL